MPILTVITDACTREIPFAPGACVRDILDAAGVFVRSGCSGNGACGLCLVEIEAGDEGSPTENECLVLSPEEIERRARLACQLTPQGDLRIRLLNTAPKSAWRDLAPGILTPSGPHRSAGVEPNAGGYGLAVDLGTTHISLSLWDMEQGGRLCGRIGLNPQRQYGSDVVSRLIAASESPEHARAISRLGLDAVHDAMSEMCGRGGAHPGRVTRVAIVGNTAMLALLTQSDSRPLLQPRYWESPIDCGLTNAEDWVGALGICPEATIDVVSPLAGFVGSDLLAGVLATGLTRQPGGLLIDFGTNSEMALWDGDTLWVTSAAGGPAFESCQTQCGMPAEDGAIYRLERQGDSGWAFHVIGGGDVKGICGSGLVDLIACLRGEGSLTPTGKFAAPHGVNGFGPRAAHPALRLTHGDVDVFQRAKAAIGVGIQALLAGARMGVADLRQVCVCGAFGQHLDPRNAQAIGLLPQVAPERVELCGNTALAGCERLLLSPACDGAISSLRRRATVINMSRLSGFDSLFLENLYLQPLRAEAS